MMKDMDAKRQSIGRLGQECWLCLDEHFNATGDTECVFTLAASLVVSIFQAEPASTSPQIVTYFLS